MPESIEDNANILLRYLYGLPRDVAANHTMAGPEIRGATGLEPNEINDAVAILDQAGLVETMNNLGTAPFNFGAVSISPRGRFEYERSLVQPDAGAVQRTTAPVGSPFGFDDEHWEIVTRRRAETHTLHVVLGYQFSSTHYVTDLLRRNIEATFQHALSDFNELPGSRPATVAFRSLAAGYGTHLFNEIAADIISADVAVFEVSDQNPNVMLEVGVALTWGVRVLLFKDHECAAPPTDLAGLTWVDHMESAATIPDSGHDEKLLRLVERALRKKL